MINYLYVYIKLVPSELDSFQKGPNRPTGEDKPIPEGDPIMAKVGGQNKPTAEVAPEGHQ